MRGARWGLSVSKARDSVCIILSIGQQLMSEAVSQEHPTSRLGKAVLLGFLPLRCSTRGFLSWRAFSICRLKASSWRAMLGAVSSSPHSPMATQSGDAIFPSSQLQSTSSRALGCTPQVRSTFTWPTMAGMCASHSARNTWLDTTASNPSTYDERCSCWKNCRMFSIVAPQNAQCFPCRWSWLLPLAWQCQQAFSGTQNHGKWMAWTCFFKHLRGSPHTVHWANSVSFPDSPAGFAGRVPSGSLGAASSWAVIETVRTSMGISGARFSCSPLLRVLVSATPLAGLRNCTCDCATLLRGDLPLPVTRLNSGDLLLSRPESPLALLGALALEPSFAPLLPLSLQLTVTVDCTDRSGDLLLSRRTGDLLLGERALLGDSPRVLSGRALSSPALLHCSWRPPRRERLRSSWPTTGLRPRAWGPLLLSGLLSVLWRPRSSWGLLLRELLPRRRERLRSSPLLAPGRPWYTTRRSPAKREKRLSSSDDTCKDPKTHVQTLRSWTPPAIHL